MPVYAPYRQNYEWPQDDLTPPAGGGPMPPTEVGNRFIVGREYATYSCRFTFDGSVLPNQGFGAIQRTTILTDQSGDFWVDQIAALGLVSINLAGGGFQVFRTDSIAMAIQIADMRTGSSPFTTQVGAFNWDGSAVALPWPQNAAPLSVLRKTNYAEDNNFVVDNIPLPSGFRGTGTLPQPFCVTRQGGLYVTATNFQNLNVSTGLLFKRLDVSLMISGWKEYANASR